MRCFDLITEEGTLNNATFPAAVSRGPIGPAWLTGSLVARVPVPDARPVTRTGQERPGHLLRNLGHRDHRRPRRTRRATRAVPQHHHGADGRRVRRPPARRRHRHRRAVLHPDGPHPRRRDDRVPLPRPHPVAARGPGLRRTRPPPRRRRSLGGDHPARHQRADGPRPRLCGQGRRAERRALPAVIPATAASMSSPGRAASPRCSPPAGCPARWRRSATRSSRARTTRRATWPRARYSR